MLNAQTAWQFQIIAVLIFSMLVACGGGGASKGDNAGTAPYTSSTSIQINSRSSANFSELPVNLSSKNQISSQRRISNSSFHLPTLSSAAAIYDRERPSTPQLYIVTIAHNFVQLRWLPATDDMGVKNYKIVRTNPDNVSHQIIIGNDSLTYTDQNLTPGSTYSYEITAYDHAGNASFTSTRRQVFTPKTSLSTPNSSTSSASSINPNPISVLDENGCIIRTIDAKIGWSLEKTPMDLGIEKFEMRYLPSGSETNVVSETPHITVLFTKLSNSTFQEFEYPFNLGDCGFTVTSVDKNGVKSDYVAVK